jgi:hypothetical protein
VGVLLALPLTAPAQPSGFGQFPWGSSAAVLRQEVAKRCQQYSESSTYALCHGYQAGGLTVLLLRFDFVPSNSLAGYGLETLQREYNALRKLAIERFGNPAARTRILWFREQLFWAWTDAEAVLIERCGEGRSCLEVRTRAIIQERERRESEDRFPGL